MQNLTICKLIMLNFNCDNMKKIVVNILESFIIKHTKKLSKTDLEKIHYGLTTLYLFVSKLIIILWVAYFLNILVETIIFIIIYNVIRIPSFGLHATKSWICLLASNLVFIITPLFIKVFFIKDSLKLIIGLIAISLLHKNSPADTHKRPIVNRKVRTIYKLLTTFIAIVYVFLSIYIKDQYISNILLISLIIQVVVTSPFTYKLFNLPYNNYKNYVKGG